MESLEKGETMRIFSSEEVNVSFKRQAMEKISVEHNLEQFSSYDDFERYQFEKRKPVWIEALMAISDCKKRNDLEVQWDLFGEIFRRFHSEHMDWLQDPSSCPPEITERREAELNKVIGSFAASNKCHWKRNHEFVCFCHQGA